MLKLAMEINLDNTKFMFVESKEQQEGRSEGRKSPHLRIKKDVPNSIRERRTAHNKITKIPQDKNTLLKLNENRK